MVKRAIFVLFILFSSISAVYAANSKNITLGIQGSGPAAAVEGFKYALTIEANAAGYDVTDNLAAAKYYIKFTVEFDQAEQKPKFIVSLIKVADSSEIVSMEYYFADEEEMLLYSQLVFFLLMANLPEEETMVVAVESDNWRHKWLYLRGSLDYTVGMFQLLGDGLIAGTGVYSVGPIGKPVDIAPIDNKVILMPGISFGVEVQFIDWLSVEPGIHLTIEEAILKNYMFNMLASLEIKFPLKFFRNFMLEPYIEAAYLLRFPEEKEVFASYPMIPFGIGFQAAVRAAKDSAVFLDVNFMYFGDTGMINQFTEFFPKPEVIHYTQTALSFRVGYKHGFFDRKKK